MSFGSKSLPSATKDEERRMRLIREHGCICCRMRLGVTEHCEIHHLLIGGRRAGHRYTIGLCSWHHRGACSALPGHTRALRGPSLMDGSKAFHAVFGSDPALLAYQDRLIRVEAIAWPTSKSMRRAAA